MTDSRVEQSTTRLADGRVLVAGGFSNGEAANPRATAELYDPASGSWTQTGTMLEPRAGHTATLLPTGKVLVAGGGFSPADTLASVELYDPSTGGWTATGSMLEARAGHAATILEDGSVLVEGGGSGTDPADTLASAELYDPVSGSWTATGSLLEARAGHTATLLDGGRVVVAGGGSDSSTALASAEVYDPTTGAWTAAASMIGRRIGHSAALLADGKLLVAGGISGGLGGDLQVRDILASAELFDPVTGSWTAAGSMITPRFNFTLTRLLDGKVLAAVGDHIGIGPVLTSELYDPASDSWTATANMIEARAAQRATLLGDGRVLVVGGEGPGARGLASAELYEPGKRTQ